MKKRIMAFMLVMILAVSGFSTIAFAGDGDAGYVFEKEKIQFFDGWDDGAGAMSDISHRNLKYYKESFGLDHFISNCLIVRTDEDIEFDTSHIIEGVRFGGIYYLRYDSEESASAALEDFLKYDSVKYAEPDQIVYEYDPDIKTQCFEDVSSEDWFCPGILSMYEKNIMTGKRAPASDRLGYFGVSENLERQDVAVLLARLYEYLSGEQLNLTSTDGTYYGGAIAWVKEKYIMNGYENGDFGIGDPITRQDFATVLIRFLHATFNAVYADPHSSYVPKILQDAFPDAFKLSEYAWDEVAELYRVGVITGNDHGLLKTLDPLDPVNRAMAAAMIDRFIEVYKKWYPIGGADWSL